MKKQRKTILEAMVDADMGNWPYGARVKLSEKLDRKLCIEFLADGFLILGDGENCYIIKAIAGTNVKAYLKKAKEEM